MKKKEAKNRQQKFDVLRHHGYRSFKGGGQAFFFGTINFGITYDQCTLVVCTTFKGILGFLGQIVFFGTIGGF